MDNESITTVFDADHDLPGSPRLTIPVEIVREHQRLVVNPLLAIFDAVVSVCLIDHALRTRNAALPGRSGTAAACLSPFPVPLHGLWVDGLVSPRKAARVWVGGGSVYPAWSSSSWAECQNSEADLGLYPGRWSSMRSGVGPGQDLKHGSLSTSAGTAGAPANVLKASWMHPWPFV